MKNVILLLFLVSSLTVAQQTTIKGKIVDSETLKTLSNANVRIKGSTIGTASGTNGKFDLSGAITKNNEIIVSYVGSTSTVLQLKYIALTHIL